MSWENALLRKLSNDVEKYEIEVTKMGQNYSFFLTVYNYDNRPHLTYGTVATSRNGIHTKKRDKYKRKGGGPINYCTTGTTL